MILGIVQARLGSTRLPAKALLPMGGSTMVGYVFDIVDSSCVDEVVLCTPDGFLRNFVNGKSKVWLGERDPLAELFYAAYQYSADHIVRVTADCPFLTANIIDRVVGEHLNAGADYSYNHSDLLPSRTKEGIDVEVITFGALSELHNKSAEREHLCITKDFKVHRVDMEEEREVFSVNTLEEYIRAYGGINYGHSSIGRRSCLDGCRVARC